MLPGYPLLCTLGRSVLGIGSGAARFLMTAEYEKFFLRCSRLETDISSLDFEIKQISSRASVIECTMTSKFDKMEEKIELNTSFDAEKQADLLTRVAHLEVDNLMRESCDKWLDLLVHGLEETDDNETKNQTKAIFDKFLTKALGLAPDDIDAVDLHRLPQHPIRRESKKMNRPIIFKLLSTFDQVGSVAQWFGASFL